jgi:hypothetical protein
MNNKPILKKLYRNILILFVIIAGLILIQQKTYNDYIRESISIASITDLASKAEVQFKNFYQPIDRSLSISRKWAQSGALVLDNMKGIHAFFIPMLEEMPQVHSIKFVNEKNDLFFLTREDSFLTSGVIDNQKNPNNILMKSWALDGTLIDEKFKETDYDALQRPWYLAAKDSIAPNEVWWTKLRYIKSAERRGITACIRWDNKDQKNNFSVIAFDILLRDVYKSIARLQVTQNSQVFLFGEDHALLPLGTGDSIPEFTPDEENLFIENDQTEFAHLFKAIDSWKNSGKSLDDPIDFTDDKTDYWLGIKQIDRDYSRIWIAVLIPERDMVNQLQARQLANFSISAILLLFGIIISIIITRKYQTQLKSLSNSILGTDNPQKRLNDVIMKGESTTVEFKSTMRMNLNTNQPGKEIEIAWLKGATAFMNSEGGILLFGINDHGDYVGIEADKFENEDKCQLHFKNLINQHIGAEFTNNMSFGLIKVDDKTIAVLECKPSQKPVFLKNKNEEHFYIRSGPSSVKLQASKILEYMQDRKA